MTKRKSKTAEFKAPKKSRSRTNRQTSTVETDPPSAEENQALNTKNKDSEESTCSEGLGELQREEIPAGACPSREENTSGEDQEQVKITDAAKVPCEMEQTPPISEILINICHPLHLEMISKDQSEVIPNHEKSDMEDKNHGFKQKITPVAVSASHLDPPSSEPTMEEQLGSSNVVPEIEVKECEAKKKKRKRMGMCGLGERKMFKRQDNEQVTSEEDLERASSNSLEEEPSMETTFTTTSEEKREDHRANAQDENRLEAPKLVESLGVVPEAIPENPEAEVSETFGKRNIDSLTIGANLGHHEPLFHSEDNILDEAGVNVKPDFVEEPPKDLQDKDLLDETLKESFKTSAFTPGVQTHHEQLIMESERKIWEQVKEVTDHTSSDINHKEDPKSSSTQEDVELVDILIGISSALCPLLENSEDHSQVEVPAADAEAEEKRAVCDESSLRRTHVSSCGGDFAEHPEEDAAPGPHPDPPSPESVTDSQLNSIPLSLEDLTVPEAPRELEDASERVLSLIRELSSLNALVKDLRRRIGYVPRGAVRAIF